MWAYKKRSHMEVTEFKLYWFFTIGFIPRKCYLFIIEWKHLHVEWGTSSLPDHLISEQIIWGMKDPSLLISPAMLWILFTFNSNSGATTNFLYCILTYYHNKKFPFNVYQYPFESHHLEENRWEKFFYINIIKCMITMNDF